MGDPNTCQDEKHVGGVGRCKSGHLQLKEGLHWMKVKICPVWPDQSSKMARSSFSLPASPRLSLQKSIKSSANNKWDIGGACRAILTPCRRPAYSGREIWWEQASITRINKKGEIGSPWRSPREGLMRPKGLPLSKAENETAEVHWWINCLHNWEKPKFLCTSSRKISINLIVGFFEIEYNRHKPSIALFTSQHMKNLVNKK